MDDAFVPECKQDGSYTDVQCFEHESFAKQCWCVTSDGQEIQGTRMSDGQTPNCTAIVSDKEKHHEEPVKPEHQDKPVEPEHHDEPVEQAKPQEESPAQNQTTMEVELQIFKNDTGRFAKRWITFFLTDAVLNVGELSRPTDCVMNNYISHFWFLTNFRVFRPTINPLL